MAHGESGDITQLLQSWSCGDKTALNELVPLVYCELRRLAATYLHRERRDHTLEPTALVHETYLRLIEQIRVECRTRAQFLGIAANLMRQILVNHARYHRAVKRDGGSRVSLEESAVVADQREPDLVALDGALERLALLDPRQSRIVELRFFGGLTEDEIAEIVGVSAITVKREWRIARAVLHDELHAPVIDA